MIKQRWIPQRSPYSLIQEDIWSSRPESEWLILISCMMLNCTNRRQVDKILPEFIRRWPKPIDVLNADHDEIKTLCKPLGFASRRTKNIVMMTKMYLASPWTYAGELPGIGSYAARAWEIFCHGELGDEPPTDHALTKYWKWCKASK